MSLAELRASLGAGGESTPAVDQTPSEEEPRGVAQVVTPSGLEIYYQAAPKRLYRIRYPESLSEGMWEYSDWFEVPSVSTILDVLSKGGLSWWGMKVGILGSFHELQQKDFDDFMAAMEEASITVDHPLIQSIVDRFTVAKRTVNHIKEAAGDRGTSAHTALENYADIQAIPDPQFYPAHERGYIAGLAQFLRDATPNILFSEVMVGSTDGWAGRFDCVANLDFASEVVVKTYPKKKPKTANVNGVWLLDLKTGKGVYEGYKFQTAAYRHGFESCGYGKLDHAGVVRLTADGKYELVEVTAPYEDFLSVLETYRAIKRLK